MVKICNKCGKDLADELVPKDSEYFGKSDVEKAEKSVKKIRTIQY